MSVMASLYISFKGQINALELIEKLLEGSWSYNDHGKISYLPKGDGGMFDWKQENLDNWVHVQNVVQDKWVSGELVGVSLTWSDTQVGGEFLIDPNEMSLNVCLSINRKTSSTSKDTDFQWYESKITTLLTLPGFEINEVRRSQVA